MIEPLFGGMTTIELLSRLTAFGKTDPYEIVRLSFRRFGGAREDAFFNYVQEGVFKGKSEYTQQARFDDTRLPQLKDEVEVCFTPDPTVYDGRFANNAWLQECPDPVTKLTWDNAAIISLAMAKRLSLDTGDMVRIEVGGRSLEIPIYILPGCADNSITLPLGYGRSRGGVICKGAGFNTYLLRPSDGLGFVTGASVTKLTARTSWRRRRNTGRWIWTST
jgi:molybdopterin-containing oxidoreductase family iron-sulfur binding subunit